MNIVVKTSNRLAFRIISIFNAITCMLLASRSTLRFNSTVQMLVIDFRFMVYIFPGIFGFQGIGEGVVVVVLVVIVLCAYYNTMESMT